jgi:hypothetical protein
MQNLKLIFFGFIGAFLFHVFKDQFISTAQAKDEKIMTATGFNLVDSQGRLRAQLGFAKEGPPGLWLMDEKGVARVVLGLYPDGTGHYGLQDKSGRMIQLARSFGNEESPLLIFKHQGQDSMLMGLNPTDQIPFLMYYDKARTRKLEFGKYKGP